MSLEKVAQYREEIEKIASRAWKRNLGRIGEKGIEKLVESGVLNRKKELKGLRRGTQGILKKEQAKMFRNSEHFAGIGTKNAVNNARKAGGSYSAEDIATAKETLKNMGPGAMPGIDVKGIKHKGVAHVRKNSDKQVRNLINDNVIDEYNSYADKKMKSLKPIPRKDRESKKWKQALFERHEADEVRFGNKAMKSKNKVMDIDGVKYPTTMFSSHISPKVLVAESANVALAPKNAKNSMKHLRNYNQKQVGHSQTEMGALKEHSGKKFQYGKSGAYDKKTAKKLENNVSRVTKDMYRSNGYNV